MTSLQVHALSDLGKVCVCFPLMHNTSIDSSAVYLLLPLPQTPDCVYYPRFYSLSLYLKICSLECSQGGTGGLAKEVPFPPIHTLPLYAAVLSSFLSLKYFTTMSSHSSGFVCRSASTILLHTFLVSSFFPFLPRLWLYSC